MMKKKTLVDHFWSTYSNYFLSGWIANLGVVPLFLLAAFLLLPIFFNLLALLVLVTRVFETIFQALTVAIQLKRNDYLSLKMLIVKGLLVTSTYAAEPPVRLSRGEYHELTIENLRQYSVANKEIISTRYDSQKKKLIIKALKLGHTDILLWKNQSSVRLPVYVISKRAQLKIQQNLELLKKYELNTEVVGNEIIVKGEIQALEQYRIIHQVISSENVQIKASLSPKLRNEIISSVLERFFTEGVLDIVCNESGPSIDCRYYDDIGPGHETIKDLKKKYQINFIKLRPNYIGENFRLKLKIIGLERENGSEINFGLDQISAQLPTLFKKGLLSFVENNEVFFKARKLIASTLAEPELIVKNNITSSVQIGSEVPFQNQTENGTITNWKFAGLKVNFKLHNKGKKFFLSYTTEFTSHNNGPVSGNKESSELRIDFSSPIKLFEVGLKSKGSSKVGVPLLKEIPILGNLFSYNSETVNFKRIIAYVSIERIENMSN